MRKRPRLNVAIEITWNNTDDPIPGHLLLHIAGPDYKQLYDVQTWTWSLSYVFSNLCFRHKGLLFQYKAASRPAAALKRSRAFSNLRRYSHHQHWRIIFTPKILRATFQAFFKASFYAYSTSSGHRSGKGSTGSSIDRIDHKRSSSRSKDITEGRRKRKKSEGYVPT